MRILLYGLNFTPEPTGIGKYTGEMSTWLANRGHQVRAISAVPYYPFWKVQPGYPVWNYKSEIIDGAEIWRSPLWVPARPRGATRLIHLASFAAASAPLLAMSIQWKPDAVFVVAPALFCAAGGLALAQATSALSCLHIQDFEVDAALDLGLIKNNHVAASARLVERALMSQFDWVSTISPKMINRLHEKGVSPQRTVLFPNWVDCRKIYPLPGASPFRAELGIAEDQIVALYSGAFGEKQGIEILIQAAQKLVDHKNLVFVIAGAGPAFERFSTQSSHLANLRCYPLQPVERLNDWLNIADIHLLPQRSSAADLVMPSKLTGMLASGRPIIATAEAGTQVALAVQKAGLVTEPEKINPFVAAIKRLANDKALREKLGRKGRAMALAEYDQDVVLEKLEADLGEAIAAKSQNTRSVTADARDFAAGLAGRLASRFK